MGKQANSKWAKLCSLQSDQIETESQTKLTLIVRINLTDENNLNNIVKRFPLRKKQRGDFKRLTINKTASKTSLLR
jgi:hypothetical protein